MNRWLTCCNLHLFARLTRHSTELPYGHTCKRGGGGGGLATYSTILPPKTVKNFEFCAKFPTRKLPYPGRATPLARHVADLGPALQVCVRPTLSSAAPFALVLFLSLQCPDINEEIVLRLGSRHQIKRECAHLTLAAKLDNVPKQAVYDAIANIYSTVVSGSCPIRFHVQYA